MQGIFGAEAFIWRAANGAVLRGLGDLVSSVISTLSSLSRVISRYNQSYLTYNPTY